LTQNPYQEIRTSGIRCIGELPGTPRWGAGLSYQKR